MATVTFWEHENRGGASKTLNDGRYHNMRFPDKDWGDCIGSIETGADTWVIAYEDEDFEDTFLFIPPNTLYKDLGELNFNDEIDSMIVQNHPFSMSQLLAAVAESMAARSARRRGGK